MESENLDLQIQDVDTGYEKNPSKVPHDTSNPNSKKLPEGSFIAHEPGIAWDKIEMVIYFVVLSILVFVVAITITYFLKKWTKKTDITNLNSPDPVLAEETEQSSYQLGKLQFSLDTNYLIQKLDEQTLSITIPSSNQPIYVSTFETEAFLHAEFIEDSLEKFSQLCPEYLPQLENCQIEVAKKHIIPTTSKHQVFYNPENIPLDVYLVKIDSSPKYGLMIFSNSNIDAKLPDQILNHLEIID